RRLRTLLALPGGGSSQIDSTRQYPPLDPAILGSVRSANVYPPLVSRPVPGNPDTGESEQRPKDSTPSDRRIRPHDPAESVLEKSECVHIGCFTPRKVKRTSSDGPWVSGEASGPQWEPRNARRTGG